MPGKPSSGIEIESPTGCTKQLISVAARPVPAAELMRPAGTKPRCCASRNLASHSARRASGSTAASARATRRRTSSTVRSSPFAYFSASTSALIGCAGSGVRVGSSRVEDGSRVMVGRGGSTVPGGRQKEAPAQGQGKASRPG
jgi:hypothetical protein